MGMFKDFTRTEEREPHRDRTQTILRSHPEVRALIGKNPYTFLLILFTVTLQIALAIVLRESSWWIVILIAYGVGAFADHALFVMVHECAHNLVDRKSVV